MDRRSLQVVAHRHGPGDGDGLQIPRRLKRTLVALVIPILALTAIGLLALWPRGAGPDLSATFGQAGDLEKATVTRVISEPCASGDDALADDLDAAGTAEFVDECETVTARISESGRDVVFDAGGPSNPLERGDKILVASTNREADSYYFADFQRESPMALLFVLFVGAAIAFGRWSGLRALVALLVSLLVLVWFVLPSVLHGHSPLAVALVGSSLIMVAVLYITGGLKTQTTVAVLGTFASLALIATLAWIFVQLTHVTGLANEDSVYLQAAASQINLQGLLLGGIIIGSLGVLDDMTVTQVSAVWELRQARSDYSARALYSAAARIGRDHIASTVNTLVLAYAGASLPLMIFFTQSNLQLRHILTGEVVAIEVVRTLVGSIGLIASVPITTALAAFVVTRHSVDVHPESASVLMR